MRQDTAPGPMQNRRRAHRLRVLKAAKLVSATAWVYVDGVVKDQSATGALIACPHAASVADAFRLLIVKDATIQPCQVVWRKETLLGVSFTGPARPAPPRRF